MSSSAGFVRGLLRLGYISHIAMEIALIGPMSVCLGVLSCFICWFIVAGEEENTTPASKETKEHLARIEHWQKRYNFTKEDGEGFQEFIKYLASESNKNFGAFGDAMADILKQHPAKNKSEFMDCLYNFCQSVELADPTLLEVSRDVPLKEGSDMKLDIVLVWKRRWHRGLIFEGDYGGDRTLTSEAALNRTVDNKYLEVFQTPRYSKYKIEGVILMGLCATHDGGFSISYLVNSTDIADAITMIRA